MLAKAKRRLAGVPNVEFEQIRLTLQLPVRSGSADNRGEFARWARAGDDEGVRSRFYTETEAQAMLEMAGLHPQDPAVYPR